MTHLRTTFVVLALAACATRPAPPSIPPAPSTEARPVTETLHGVELTDPYRWLEDQDSPETRAWINRQNAYTDAVLGNRPEATLFSKRLTELMNIEEISGTPTYANGRYFLKKRKVGADLHSIYVREGMNGEDQLLIDPTPMSADHSTNIGFSDVSDDGKLIAYYVRKGGADEVEVHFFDVDARREVGVPLPSARYYSVDIAPDRTIYYGRRLPIGPRVGRRAMQGGEETPIFGEGYTRDKIIYSSLAEGGDHLLIHVLHGSAPKKTEIYVDDLRDAAGPRTVVNDRDFRSYGELAGDSIVIQTNWDAPNDRLMLVRISNPNPDQWKEIVPQNPKAAIQSISLAGGTVFVKYLEDVKPRIIGYDLQGNRRDDIAFDTPGFLADVTGSWETPVAFFSFSSLHQPWTLYHYEVASRTRTVFPIDQPPVRPEDFTIIQVWYPSKDGTRIPMFVMHRKGLSRNGRNPVYLTGYGGFSASQMPAFSARAVAWAEQGGVYALPNLRGGGEFGEEWHRAGMLERKQNTFDDFIAAGEYLIREGYTSPRHLGIAGGSNGGLLVMAAETQRPELFGAVVCRFPLIDMIRYHQFLVGGFWVPEYGSGDDPAQFPFIYAYSPYHRVKKGTNYPATLFITGDADTRVAPLHARKMTALMQAMNGSNEPILLRYHTASGHSAGEPLSVQVKNLAEEMGFMWWQLR